jgi:hypothetical protein
VSEYRAILVSRCPFGWEFADGSKSYMVAADAAGDQPRIRWCAEHQQPAVNYSTKYGLQVCPGWAWESDEGGCRVVDAIVVPLKGAS